MVKLNVLLNVKSEITKHVTIEHGKRLLSTEYLLNNIHIRFGSKLFSQYFVL